MSGCSGRVVADICADSCLYNDEQFVGLRSLPLVVHSCYFDLDTYILKVMRAERLKSLSGSIIVRFTSYQSVLFVAFLPYVVSEVHFRFEFQSGPF